MTNYARITTVLPAETLAKCYGTAKGAIKILSGPGWAEEPYTSLFWAPVGGRPAYRMEMEARQKTMERLYVIDQFDRAK